MSDNRMHRVSADEIATGLAHARFLDGLREFEEAQRAMVHRYAWLMCSCRMFRDPGNPQQPAQAGCVVHGQMIVTDDGRVL